MNSAESNDLAGHSFVAGSDAGDYVEDAKARGPFTKRAITLTTQSTGQKLALVLNFTAQQKAGGGQFSWCCSNDNTPSWI